MKYPFFLALTALFIPLTLPGQGTLPFQVGETLHYDSNLNFVRAGTAKLQVLALESVDDVPAYHILFTMSTNSILDHIFKIRDRVETWIDAEDLYTLRFNKQVREGRHRYRFSANMNYEDSVVTTGDESFKFDHELRDPYSLLYYLRTLPLKVGDEFSFVTFDNNQFMDIHLTVHRKERIDVRAGEFDCFVVEPFREGRPLLKNKADMTIWLSDDHLRLPVKVVSKAVFGSIILKLRKLED
ncbi:MAG: DUF3108 domain-containing protein [Candidatus Neomarinimicrobiota bacterium]